MMKIASVAVTAAVALSALAGTASAEGLIRKHIDNGLNRIESALGDDSAAHDVRSLSDLIALRDAEIDSMLRIMAAKSAERAEAAAALAAMGVAAPEPRVVVAGPDPDAVPGDVTPAQTCLTSLAGAPIACW